MTESTKKCALVRFRGTTCLDAYDHLAVEEPLEIRVNGYPVAVIMRTPGDDESLTLGFLVSERVVDHPDDVVSIRHCTQLPSDDAEDNVIEVRLHPRVRWDPASLRRNLFAASSCGVCGRGTIEGLLKRCVPLRESWSAPLDTLLNLPRILRAGQKVFRITGGLHAAALVSPEGRLCVLREDIGRHNAVDKVLGWKLSRTDVPPSLLLVVSGRIAFEVVQKAAVSRISMVIGLSAPSSLAIELAEKMGICVAGFIRDRSINVYTFSHRIRMESV